ncbi:MAG: hypothetical protein HYY08_03680 [Firmicutes bacterium]|nr:hypothetical protein [Bacillota bacterium]
MTSRERHRATCSFGNLDRYYIHEFGPWAATDQLWRADGLPDDWRERNHFREDGMCNLRREGVDLGFCRPAYFPRLEVQELKDEGQTRIIRDSDGIVKRVFKTNPETSMPQFLEFPVKTEKDWECVKPLLSPGHPERYAALEEVDTRLESGGSQVPLMIGIEGAYMRLRNLLGEENLAYAFYDAPGMLHDMMEVWADLMVEGFEHVLRYVKLDEVEFAEDLCYKGGPLLSPRHFREYITPNYRRVIGVIKRLSPETVVNVDSDGNLEEMVPLMVEAGVDMICPFEVAAGNDVVSFRKRYPNLIIRGGIDKRALARGPEAIDHELERVLPAMWESGGYFPCLDHTVPTDVSLARFEYYLERLRKFHPNRTGCES